MHKSALPVFFTLATLLGAGMSAQAAEIRDHVRIAGSSTVYPFASAVARHLSENGFKTPEVESIGSGGGIRELCKGTGPETIDIANASRPIKESEREACRANGVGEIVELKIGYDGIVLANHKDAPGLVLDRRDLFLALAAEVPAPDGSSPLVANPYHKWSEINPDLPDRPIEVLGPPPGSGTRDVFLEMVMVTGCKRLDLNWAMEVHRLGTKSFSEVCNQLREDGIYVDAGEDDDRIVEMLKKRHNAVGIFGYSYLNNNAEQIQGAAIDGIPPSFLAIKERIYRLSRPLFLYVKKAHLGKVRGLDEYLAEITSEDAWGENGYLRQLGMIPMPKDEREEYSMIAAEQFGIGAELAGSGSARVW